MRNKGRLVPMELDLFSYPSNLFIPLRIGCQRVSDQLPPRASNTRSEEREALSTSTSPRKPASTSRPLPTYRESRVVWGLLTAGENWRLSILIVLKSSRELDGRTAYQFETRM